MRTLFQEHTKAVNGKISQILERRNLWFGCEIVDALVELRQENATLSRSAIERRIFRTVKAQLANALREAEERECPY
jgi:hypothetical protein